MRGSKLPKLHYECPRCGDTYDCATQDEQFLVTTHRLLHRAGDWKQALWRAAYWTTTEDASTAPAASTSMQ